MFNPFKRDGDAEPVAQEPAMTLFGAPYKPHVYPELAFKFCLLGANDDELASMLDVSTETIRMWMHTHPLFRRSVVEGRKLADAEVAHSMYRCATGYTREEVKIFQFQGVPVVVPYTQYYAPDVSAQKHWLAVRQKDRWRVIEATDVTLNASVETKRISADATPEQAADMYKKMLG